MSLFPSLKISFWFTLWTCIYITWSVPLILICKKWLFAWYDIDWVTFKYFKLQYSLLLWLYLEVIIQDTSCRVNPLKKVFSKLKIYVVLVVASFCLFVCLLFFFFFFFSLSLFTKLHVVLSQMFDHINVHLNLKSLNMSFW